MLSVDSYDPAALDSAPPGATEGPSIIRLVLAIEKSPQIPPKTRFSPCFSRISKGFRLLRAAFRPIRKTFQELRDPLGAIELLLARIVLRSARRLLLLVVHVHRHPPLVHVDAAEGDHVAGEGAPRNRSQNLK